MLLNGWRQEKKELEDKAQMVHSWSHRMLVVVQIQSKHVDLEPI